MFATGRASPAGAAPVSFGAYYKTTRDRPQLKAFLAAARDVFAAGGPPPAAKDA